VTPRLRGLSAEAVADRVFTAASSVGEGAKSECGVFGCQLTYQGLIAGLASLEVDATVEAVKGLLFALDPLEVGVVQRTALELLVARQIEEKAAAEARRP
jgi:hypothetical protein